MPEFEGAFGLLKGDDGVGAFNAERLQAQHGDFPDLIDHHFQTCWISDPVERCRWNGGELTYPVPGDEARQSVPIGGAGANGLVVIDPQLAEFQDPVAEPRRLRHPNPLLGSVGQTGNGGGDFFPAGEGNASAQDRVRTRGGGDPEGAGRGTGIR